MDIIEIREVLHAPSNPGGSRAPPDVKGLWQLLAEFAPPPTLASGAYGLTRPYTRYAAVEAAIRALPPATDPALLPALFATDVPEVLVHGVRRLLRAGQPAAARQMAERLIPLVSPLLARLAAAAPVRPADRDDLVQLTLTKMWHAILDVTPPHEFWEVHFAATLRRTAADVGDALRRAHRHERPFLSGADPAGGWNDEQARLPDPAPRESDLFVAQALAHLPADLRRAVWLQQRGFKTVSVDPQEPTISSLLGVSERTVRKYLAAAYALLRTWLTETRAA